MNRGFDTKSPGRTHEPWMPIVDGLAAWQRVPRMQVQRNVELFHLRPERQIARIIQIHNSIGISDLRVTIHHGSFEAEFPDTPRQLGYRSVRVLHRQRRKTSETIRAFRDEVCEQIIGLTRDLNGVPGVGYTLDGGVVQR